MISRYSVRPYFSLIRCTHLVKNFLVFAPLVFSLQFTEKTLVAAVFAFLAFSFIASAVYVLNDILDVEADRQHPEKRKRPLASGAISISQALIFFALLFLSGLLIACLLPQATFFIIIGYFLMNVAYSHGLKKVPIIDVMIVAFGFVFRILTGAVAVAVSLSPWILLCTFFGALFIAVGKRKGEIAVLKENSGEVRNVLSSYQPDFLNHLISSTAAITIICYALYTIDTHTIERLGTEHLMYTLPFVVFGIFRYFQILSVRSGGDDPTRIFLTDSPILITIFLWIFTFGAIVHFSL